jgi:hypothetical protein
MYWSGSLYLETRSPISKNFYQGWTLGIMPYSHPSSFYDGDLYGTATSVLPRLTLFFGYQKDAGKRGGFFIELEAGLKVLLLSLNTGYEF